MVERLLYADIDYDFEEFARARMVMKGADNHDRKNNKKGGLVAVPLFSGGFV